MEASLRGWACGLPICRQGGVAFAAAASLAVREEVVEESHPRTAGTGNAIRLPHAHSAQRFPPEAKEHNSPGHPTGKPFACSIHITVLPLRIACIASRKKNYSCRNIGTVIRQFHNIF